MAAAWSAMAAVAVVNGFQIHPTHIRQAVTSTIARPTGGSSDHIKAPELGMSIDTYSSDDLLAGVQFTLARPDLTDQIQVPLITSTGEDSSGQSYGFKSPETRMTETLTSNEITASSHSIQSPGIPKILLFAIPAIGVWLCG